jgi:CRISPR/Cas system CSM-associated protein Csm2 small subunit
MRTQEARAVEGLANILRKLLDKTEDSMNLYDDDKAREALKRLQIQLPKWGIE